MYPNVYAALSTIAKVWKEPKCPSTDEWIKTLWFIYTMEYYLAMRKNEIWPFVATWRRMKLDHFLTSFTKINSKGIKDLNVRQETIQTLEEKAGKNLSDLSHSNFLLDTSPKPRELKAKVNHCDLMKIKRLLHCKGNNQQN